MVMRLFWCTQADVVATFRIVGQEIRNKCARYESAGLNQRDAIELAGRVREQRELVRQMTERRNFKHARRLLRLNSRSRKRVADLVRQAGLDADLLIFK